MMASLVLQCSADLFAGPLDVLEVKIPICLARCANTDEGEICSLYRLNRISGCTQAAQSCIIGDNLPNLGLDNWAFPLIDEIHFYRHWVNTNYFVTIPREAPCRYRTDVA